MSKEFLIIFSGLINLFLGFIVYRKEIEQYMHERMCSVCKGRRLKTESLNIKAACFNPDLRVILDAVSTVVTEKITGLENELKILEGEET